MSHECAREDCSNDSWLRIKIGAVWGHYCERHMMDALECLTQEEESVEVRALEETDQ